MSTQARIPVALAALHNFNWEYEGSEVDPAEDEELNPIHVQADGGDDDIEHNGGVNEPNEIQDRIAEAMWAQYLEEHIRHGIPLHV